MKNNEFKSSIRKQSGLAMDNNAEPHTHTPTAHFVLSATGRIVSLNTYGLELLDNIRSKVIGRKFNSFIAEKHHNTNIKSYTIPLAESVYSSEHLVAILLQTKT